MTPLKRENIFKVFCHNQPCQLFSENKDRMVRGGLVTVSANKALLVFDRDSKWDWVTEGQKVRFDPDLRSGQAELEDILSEITMIKGRNVQITFKKALPLTSWQLRELTNTVKTMQ